MGKPLTKDSLLEEIRVERRRLEQNIAGLSSDVLSASTIMGNWSIKDILAHLVEWEQMFLGWYKAGLRGETPVTPAPGLTWGQLHILNQRIYEKHCYRPLTDVLNDFQQSYKQVLETVQSIPEEMIFTPGFFSWTGKHNLEGFISANTSSHYRWAKTEIRKGLIRIEQK